MKERPIVLTISPGRSGTKFLFNTFRENYSNEGEFLHELLDQGDSKPAIYHRCFDDHLLNQLSHEPAISRVVSDWSEKSAKKPIVEFGWTMSHLAPLIYREFGARLKVLNVVRHPIAQAASTAIQGAYKEYKSEDWAITPLHPQSRFKSYSKTWNDMFVFEKCLFRWMEVVAYSEELKERFPEIQFMTVKSEDFFRSKKTIAEIADFMGFENDRKIELSPKKNEIQLFNLERRPIGAEWKRYDKFPELVKLAGTYGFDMSESFVEELISRYQLPSGVWPFLRHHLGYWTIKERVGKALRH